MSPSSPTSHPDAPQSAAGDRSVSVIIPTYNRSRLVLRAALSALMQTLPATEIIIVDDGSKDDTEAACRRLEAAAAGLSAGRTVVRYFKQPRNRGTGAARNRGVAEARSRYVAFLDSDDIWHPDKLKRQFAEIDAFDNAAGRPVFSYTGRMRIDQHFRLLARQMASRLKVATRLRQSNIFGTPSSILMEKKLLDEVGGFNETLKACEDWEMYLRAAPKAAMVGTASPLIMYFDADIETMTRSKKSYLQAHLAVYKQHIKGRVDNAQLTDLYFTVAESLAALGRGRCAARFYAASLRPTYRIKLVRDIVARLTWRRLPKMRYAKYRADIARGEANEAYKGENAAYIRDYRAAVEKYDKIAGGLVAEPGTAPA